VELSPSSRVTRAAKKEGAALASSLLGYSADAGRTPTVDQVRVQVDRILKSGPLARVNRTHKLFQYIVEHTLSGSSKRLKQYSIAIEALGRGADFDPDTDPVVRLEASKLRRALDDYYLRAGANDPVRISIPKGSYAPKFELVDAGSRHAEAASTPAGVVNFGAPAFNVQRILIIRPHIEHRTDPSQSVATGMFEQLNVELARYSDISLVTHPEAQNELALDPVGAGMKAQARFVISGSVRQSGEQIRITVRLHDVRAGAIIWIESFDLDTRSTGLQAEDTIARRIAGAIADYYGVISHMLSLQSVYSVGKPWNLQDAIQRHRYLARTLTERVYRIARTDLEVGTNQAPYDPMIWAALAHTIFYGNVLGFDNDENWMTVVYRYAQRSFELDHKCAFGHVVTALHGLYQREFDDVLETCKQILQDNPHAPSTKLSAGFFRALAGDWVNGCEMLNSALSGLLHPPGWAYRVNFLDQYRRKNYVEALHEIGKYHAPENFTPPLLRAAALAQLGRVEEASSSIEEVLRICPRIEAVVPRYFRYLTAFDDISDHLMQGLHKAGLKL
jgi:adenylate cyclase